MNLDKFAKLDLRTKIISSVTVIVLLLFGIVYFIIIPVIDDIKKMGNEINLQRVDLEKKYIKGQSLNKLSNNLKKIEPKLATLDNIFIDQNRALEFISTIEEVANKNSINQKINLMTNNAKKENDYKKIPLQVIVEGEFADILQYISSIEALGYYININTVEMTKSSDSLKGSSKRVLAQIMADTYWK